MSPEDGTAEGAGASPVRELARAGVAGTHRRIGEAELRLRMRAIVAGDARALLGLEPLFGVTTDDVSKAVADVWGWPDAAPLASADPAKTLEAMGRLVAKVDEVASRAGTIAFATGRPASLLPLYVRLAERAIAHGATVPDLDDSGEFLADGRASRRVRWLDGVAVLTDGTSLLPTAAIEAGDQLVGLLGRADLVVGDHGFATAALDAGWEIAAFADFDALVLAVVAAHQPERCAALVPLDDQRPPQAYAPLTALVSVTRDH